MSAQTHRLTLLPWSEQMPSWETTHDGRPTSRVDEPRWTAACDCGWFSTTWEQTPGDVLSGYSEHLTGDPFEGMDISALRLAIGEQVNAACVSSVLAATDGKVDGPRLSTYEFSVAELILQVIRRFFAGGSDV